VFFSWFFGVSDLQQIGVFFPKNQEKYTNLLQVTDKPKNQEKTIDLLQVTDKPK
jgi:hypothetical protein